MVLDETFHQTYERGVTQITNISEIQLEIKHPLSKAVAAEEMLTVMRRHLNI